jgi:hypothetical protein
MFRWSSLSDARLCPLKPRARKYSRDPIRCAIWIVVLPDPYDLPASGFQHRGVATVAFAGGTKLAPPPLSVSLWQDAVLWTAVPEAAVDVDNNLRWTEYDIGGGPEIPLGSPVHAEAQSATVKLGSKA